MKRLQEDGYIDLYPYIPFYEACLELVNKWEKWSIKTSYEKVLPVYTSVQAVRPEGSTLNNNYIAQSYIFNENTGKFTLINLVRLRADVFNKNAYGTYYGDITLNTLINNTSIWTFNSISEYRYTEQGYENWDIYRQNPQIAAKTNINKDKLIGYEYSFISDKFPENGVQEGYWYIKVPIK